MNRNEVFARTRQMHGEVAPTTPTPGEIRIKCGGCLGALKRAGVLSWSLTKALARWTAAGWPITPETARAERWQLCLACEKYNAKKQRCKLCGCDLAAKIGMATESCPLSKWPTLPPAREVATESPVAPIMD